MTKKNFGKSSEEVNIREIVRDEVQKILAREKQRPEGRTQRQLNSAKRTILSDLTKIPVSNLFEGRLGKDIASQIVRSIIGKL